MRRFLIQQAEATLAEGVVFSCGLVSVRPLPAAFRNHHFHVDHVAQFVSLDLAEAHFHQVSEGLSTLVFLDDESGVPIWARIAALQETP